MSQNGMELQQIYYWIISNNTFYVCVKLSFHWLKILLFYKRKLFQIFDQIRELFKNNNSKIKGFAKKGEKKTRMTKVAKSCHQVTWTKKHVTKKRKLQ